MSNQREKRVCELVSAGGEMGRTQGMAKPVYFKDGRIVMVKPDGSSLCMYPGGGLVLDLPDGRMEELAPYTPTRKS
jgi:hypothetical protein